MIDSTYIYKALYQLMAEIYQLDFPIKDAIYVELSIKIKTKDNILMGRKEIDEKGSTLEVNK